MSFDAEHVPGRVVELTAERGESAQNEWLQSDGGKPSIELRPVEISHQVLFVAQPSPRLAFEALELDSDAARPVRRVELTRCDATQLAVRVDVCGVMNKSLSRRPRVASVRDWCDAQRQRSSRLPEICRRARSICDPCSK